MPTQGVEFGRYVIVQTGLLSQCTANAIQLDNVYIIVTWVQGLAGALMRRRNSKCHFCLSWSAKRAASASTRNTTHSSSFRVVFCPSGLSSTSLSLSVSQGSPSQKAVGINATAHVYCEQKSYLISQVYIFVSQFSNKVILWHPDKVLRMNTYCKSKICLHFYLYNYFVVEMKSVFGSTPKAQQTT
jgi:hypothetical protein